MFDRGTRDSDRTVTKIATKIRFTLYLGHFLRQYIYQNPHNIFCSKGTRCANKFIKIRKFF